MNTTTVAVDLAKDVFEIAVADRQWRVTQTARLSRSQFSAWFENRAVDRVIMEACGSAHHWARWLNSQNRLTERTGPTPDVQPVCGRSNSQPV